MKRHLAPSLFALCALLGGTRAAEAQSADAIVPATIDSVDASAPARSSVAIVAQASASSDLRPMIRALSPVLSDRASATADAALPADYSSVLGRTWKMPTSRTLMIGGTVAAIVGLAAVGGDAGAIIAMAGGGVAVYGLYLHYNR